MPCGPGRGRGGGGQRKMLFLQSCLLVLLHRGPGYGYSLMSDLREFGVATGQMDISILYRALRDLEAADLVSSAWDEISLGPKRRVYTITPQGEARLGDWMQLLEARRRQIETLEVAYAAVAHPPDRTKDT